MTSPNTRNSTMRVSITRVKTDEKPIDRYQSSSV